MPGNCGLELAYSSSPSKQKEISPYIVGRKNLNLN